MLLVDTRYRTLCCWEIRYIGRYGVVRYEIHDDMLVADTKYRKLCLW